MNMEQYDTLLQAIEALRGAEKYDLKGILVNGYGVSSDALTQEMVEKLA